jgi:hypothetical protein
MSTIKWDIFLSHAGEDHERAAELTAWINAEIRHTEKELRIFNTSECENRFREPDLAIGANWTETYRRYNEELRRYLAENMAASRVYLLMVTPRSLQKRSGWVSFEIQTAQDLLHARSERSFTFFPCVTDGAKLFQLPPGAINFQGIDAATKDGLAMLRYQLLKRVSEARGEDHGPLQQLTER